MILDGSELFSSKTLYVLDTFATSSGLKISYEKTEVLWIGLCKDRDFLIPLLDKPITCAKSKVYVPGVHFPTLEIKESNINFREKIEKIKKNPEQLVS